MSAGPDAELRSQVAAAHGLDVAAATFLTGSTLEEIEASARSFAQLLAGNNQRRRPTPTEPGFTLGAALAAKQERQRERAALFTGRAPQPRDETGRFTRPASGFDGGARPTLPRPRSPEAEHNVVVSQLAWLGSTYRRGESF